MAGMQKLSTGHTGTRETGTERDKDTAVCTSTYGPAGGRGEIHTHNVDMETLDEDATTRPFAGNYGQDGNGGRGERGAGKVTGNHGRRQHETRRDLGPGKERENATGTEEEGTTEGAETAGRGGSRLHGRRRKEKEMGGVQLVLTRDWR